jgi:hypothetical protein
VVVGLACAGFAAVVFGPWFALWGLLPAGLYYGAMTRRFRRRRTLLAQPFPETWRQTLHDSVRFYRRLPVEQRGRFEDDVRIFLAEQTITGLGGQPVPDDVRVLIAASAAMLTFGLPEFEWPKVRDIVVYPRAFDAEYDPQARDGNIAGMVHLRGPVLFSAKDLRHGFKRSTDGHNVGLHEMAHVMDMLDGSADGVPGDLPWVATAPWVGVIANRLKRLRQHRYPEVLRDYAASNEAELFAVAVEAFFEQPELLRKHDRKLFDMLEEYFQHDPR